MGFMFVFLLLAVTTPVTHGSARRSSRRSSSKRSTPSRPASSPSNRYPTYPTYRMLPTKRPVYPTRRPTTRGVVYGTDYRYGSSNNSKYRSRRGAKNKGGYKWCADENGNCQCPTATTIRFGRSGNYEYNDNMQSVYCTRDNFPTSNAWGYESGTTLQCHCFRQNTNTNTTKKKSSTSAIIFICLAVAMCGAAAASIWCCFCKNSSDSTDGNEMQFNPETAEDTKGAGTQFDNNPTKPAVTQGGKAEAPPAYTEPTAA